MSLPSTLTLCLLLSLALACAQAGEGQQTQEKAAEIIGNTDSEGEALDWKRRSAEVQQILAPTKLDFERVGYRIGLPDALPLAADSTLGETTAEADFEFGSQTLNWSHGRFFSDASPTEMPEGIEYLEYHPDPAVAPYPPLDSELWKPEQLFPEPLDPLVREYVPGAAEVVEPPKIKSLWKEYADWFHSGFFGWTERLELGGSFLEGNTNQEAFNTAARFSRDTKYITTQINLGGNHAQSKNTTTANRWHADTTTDFKREGNWLYFVRSLHEYDQFTNLDYRGTASFGSGYRFYNEANRKLIVRYGPGVTQEIFHTPRLVRTSPDLFAEVETKWPIGPRIIFEEKATVHPNITNFGMLRVLNTTGFLIPLDDQKRWNLKIGFRYEYNGRPNANRLSNDFATNVNIVYSRK